MPNQIQKTNSDFQTPILQNKGRTQNDPDLPVTKKTTAIPKMKAHYATSLMKIDTTVIQIKILNKKTCQDQVLQAWAQNSSENPLKRVSICKSSRKTTLWKSSMRKFNLKTIKRSIFQRKPTPSWKMSIWGKESKVVKDSETKSWTNTLSFLDSWNKNKIKEHPPHWVSVKWKRITLEPIIKGTKSLSKRCKFPSRKMRRSRKWSSIMKMTCLPRREKWGSWKTWYTTSYRISSQNSAVICTSTLTFFRKTVN